MKIEFFVTVPLSEEEFRLIERAIKYVFRDVRLPADILFVHIVDSHDRVREVLGTKRRIDYEEKPIKLFIDYDTMQPILSITPKFRELSLDDLLLEIARELTTFEVIMDPIHVSKWAIPEEMQNVTPLDAMLSTAMLLRTVDAVLTERGYAEKIVNQFEINEIASFARIAEQEQYSPKVRALQALSWDVPLSLEMGGRRDVGERLFLEAVKRVITDSGKRFANKYDDFRSFSRNNFYFENVREYLDMVFEE